MAKGRLPSRSQVCHWRRFERTNTFKLSTGAARLSQQLSLQRIGQRMLQEGMLRANSRVA
jgi:hypothetical protein